MSKQSPDLTTLTDDELIDGLLGLHGNIRTGEFVPTAGTIHLVEEHRAELRRRLTPRPLRFQVIESADYPGYVIALVGERGLIFLSGYLMPKSYAIEHGRSCIESLGLTAEFEERTTMALHKMRLDQWEGQCPACGEDVPIYEFGFTDCQCGGMRFELTVNAEPIEEKEQ